MSEIVRKRQLLCACGGGVFYQVFELAHHAQFGTIQDKPAYQCVDCGQVVDVRTMLTASRRRQLQKQLEEIEGELHATREGDSLQSGDAGREKDSSRV